LISGAFSAVSSVAPSPLQEWWAERILREMGFPTVLRFEIDLPGKIVRHEMNGQTEGEIVNDDKVVFALNETFLREHGFMGPWNFVVESYVEPKPPEKQDETKPAQTNKDTGATREKFWKFRLRAVGWAAGANGLTLFKRFRNLPVIKDWAPYAARFELTELREDGSVGRRCMIQFTGTGLSVGLPYTAGFPIDWDGAELATRSGMNLEDFDGMTGSITSVGAVLGGYNKVTFGGIGPGSIAAKTEGWGWFIGLHGGWSPMYGRWDIVSSPNIPFR